MLPKGQSQIEQAEIKQSSAVVGYSSFLNEIANPHVELKFKKKHFALSVPGQFANAMALFPKKTSSFCEFLPQSPKSGSSS